MLQCNTDVMGFSFPAIELSFKIVQSPTLSLGQRGLSPPFCPMATIWPNGYDLVMHREAANKTELHDSTHRQAFLHFRRQQVLGRILIDVCVWGLQRVLEDPMLATDGMTYSKAAIEAWFKAGKRISPVTGMPLPSTKLVQNRSLKAFLTLAREAKSA